MMPSGEWRGRNRGETHMKRNPVLVYLFECTNILGCIVFPCFLYFNIGGWFYPTSDIYTIEELIGCMKHMLTASILFAVFIGIPLLLLLVDCFVIMRGIKGFQVSAISVLSAPASYPIIRTEILKEDKKKRTFHVIAGGIIFASNCLVISAYVQYMIRIGILMYGMR